MVSQRIYLGDKKRYEVLQNMLKKMGLPYEELMRIPLPKVQHVAPVKAEEGPGDQEVVEGWWQATTSRIEHAHGMLSLPPLSSPLSSHPSHSSLPSLPASSFFSNTM